MTAYELRISGVSSGVFSADLPAAAALRTPLAAAVDGGAPGPRHQRPAADDRRRRAAAPDHFAEVEAAEGVRGHACATVARRRGGHLRQRYADARIGEDATAARSKEHTSELQ